MTERLIVIGGDAAGMSAASQASRMRTPDELHITAFERGAFTSYSACGIPYLVGGVVADPDTLISRWPEEFRERQGIDVRIRHEVLSIDLRARRVRVRDLETGSERDEAFDLLMIGTGATAIRPPFPGGDADGIYGVQHHDDGLRLRRLIAERVPRSAVVVGGGYIGLEMAEAMLERGIATTVVEAADQPMPTLDDEMGALVADAMREAGITLHLGEAVEGFEARDGWVSAVVTAQRTIPADLVILGLGVRPNADLARAAGLDIGETGGIVTDDHMRCSAEGVYAAGDCVETFHRVSRAPVAIALGTHANKQGRVAGINIGGGEAAFPGVIGTAITKICAAEIGRTGLGEAEAAAAGFDAFTVTFRSTTRSGYMPNREWMTTKAVVERPTGRLLGAQVVGGSGAAKRIDAFAVCVWNEMTVEEMQHLDLSYAPPFSPVWDPVVLAARKAAERRGAVEG